MRLILIALAGVVLAAGGARADEILLDNGDRVSGTIVRKSGETLTLRTAYAGELRIDWRAVVSLRTERPLAMLVEGESAPIRVSAAPASKRAVRLSDRAGDVPLGRIAFINPLPEESGSGLSWHGHANVSASHVTGNSPGEREYGDAELTARAREYRFSMGGKTNRAHEAGVTTAQNWLASGNFDWFVTEDRFRYARASLERDRFKDLDLRAALGAGYGLQLVDTERTDVSVRGGLDYVSLERITGTDERYPALGWGVKARHRMANGLELFHEQDGFWNIEDTGQLTLRSRTGVRLPVVERLAATAQANVDWEREPPPGRKPTDTTLLLGLTYSF